MFLAGALFAAMPSSTSYQLHNYGFGSGGTNNSTSTNYSLNATTGQTTGAQSSSTTYKARPGNNNSQQANVPTGPTFDNPSNYYNKLHFVVAQAGNPTDTKFSIAISSDNFASTQYIKSDNTVGSTRAITDYQTYASWGSATGQYVTGLTPNTTYKIKTNAFQGKFTETEYGPTATAATVNPSLTFDIDTSAIDTETAPPYSAAFGNLLPGTVTNTTEKVWIDITTNGNNGGKVYVSSANAGFRSPANNFTLTSATADLAVASTGYGAQGSSATQTSGGPLSITAPFNVATSNVGILTTALSEIFSAPAQITGGRGSFQLKAKAAAATPSGNDYQDTLTMTALGAF